MHQNIPPISDCGVPSSEIAVAHSFNTIAAVDSSSDCQEHCQGNSLCRSWSYDTDLASKTCKLNRAGIVAHTKRDTFDMYPDCVEEDRTITGNDISTLVKKYGTGVSLYLLHEDTGHP